MRRSFRTRRLLVFDTRGSTPGWYTVPRWGTQSQLTFSTEPVPIYNSLRTPESLSLSTTPSEPQRACPYLQLPPNLSLSPKTMASWTLSLFPLQAPLGL